MSITRLKHLLIISIGDATFLAPGPENRWMCSSRVSSAGITIGGRGTPALELIYSRSRTPTAGFARKSAREK